MGQKRPPVGIEDFTKLLTQDFYYIDKTGMIKELLENWGEVNLFTRPRRFGKLPTGKQEPDGRTSFSPIQ